jgi:hypothetical protein
MRFLVFKTNSNNTKINEAIKIANDLLNNKELYLRVKEKASYDMSTASPEYLSDMLYKTKTSLVINVNTYYNRWTRALGYFVPSKPKDIFLNEAKLNRSVGSIVNSLYHERAHAMDYFDKNHSYGHGSNSSSGKQNTFPYFLGNLAQAIVDDNPDFNNNESSRIVYRKSLWGRFKSWVKRLI